MNPILSVVIENIKAMLISRWNANVAKVDVLPDPVAGKVDVILWVYKPRIPSENRTLLDRAVPLLGRVCVRVDEYEGEIEGGQKS